MRLTPLAFALLLSAPVLGAQAVSTDPPIAMPAIAI